MKRRVTILSCLVLGGLVWVGLHLRESSLPHYQGRSINSWFDQLPGNSQGPGPRFPQPSDDVETAARQAEQAFAKMNYAALPYLVKRYAEEDSGMEQWLRSFFESCHLRWPQFEPAEVTHRKALSGLAQLSTIDGPHIALLDAAHEGRADFLKRETVLIIKRIQLRMELQQAEYEMKAAEFRWHCLACGAGHEGYETECGCIASTRVEPSSPEIARNEEGVRNGQED